MTTRTLNTALHCFLLTGSLVAALCWVAVLVMKLAK